MNAEKYNSYQCLLQKIEKLNLITDNIPMQLLLESHFVGTNCNLEVSKQDIKNISISEVTVNKCFKN